MTFFIALERYIVFKYPKAALILYNFQKQTWRSEVRILTENWLSSYRTRKMLNAEVTPSCALLTFLSAGYKCSVLGGMEVYASISHNFSFVWQCCQPRSLLMPIIMANVKQQSPVQLELATANHLISPMYRSFQFSEDNMFLLTSKEIGIIFWDQNEKWKLIYLLALESGP